MTTKAAPLTHRSPPTFPTDAAERAIRRALSEDAADDDVSTQWTVDHGVDAEAVVLAKQGGVVAGLPLCDLVFAQLGAGRVSVTHETTDGSSVGPGASLVRLIGPARQIITGERTLLNFLQRLSGIATMTHRAVGETAGFRAKVLDTRKTAPGLRHLDKYAVRAGGGRNHRSDLGAMVLLKENHLTAAGGVSRALESVRRRKRSAGRPLRVEVEVRNLAEAREALVCGADRVMLDNMSLSDLAHAVELRDLVNPACEIEASGNITVGLVRDVAATGVDFVSLGSLTHSAPALDISLLVTATLTR